MARSLDAIPGEAGEWPPEEMQKLRPMAVIWEWPLHMTDSFYFGLLSRRRRAVSDLDHDSTCSFACTRLYYRLDYVTGGRRGYTSHVPGGRTLLYSDIFLAAGSAPSAAYCLSVFLSCEAPHHG